MQTLAYLRHPDWPEVVSQWLNLKSIQDLTSEDFGQIDVDRIWWHGRARTYQGTALLNYYPPDFPSAQLAALVQRLHAAETEGKLAQYLAHLAERAGYKLRIAGIDGLDADQAGDAANHRDVVRTDASSRILLLRALLCVNLTDEAFDAAQHFADALPGDVDCESLLAALATVPDSNRVS